MSFAPVFVRLVDVDPEVSAFYRVAIGGTALVAVTVVRRKWRVPARNVLLFAGAAGSLFALDLAFFHHSIVRVGPGLATILGNCQVFVLAAIGWMFLGERLGLRYASGTAAAVAGLFLMFGREWASLSPEYRLGIVFGLLTALCYAGYVLSLRAGQGHIDKLDPGANLAIVSVITTVLLGIWLGANGDSFRVPSSLDWGLLFAYGITAQAVAWVIISDALPHVDASRAGLILLLQPSLAFVWDMLFFGRETGPAELVGAGFVLTGIYLGLTRTGRRRADEDSGQIDVEMRSTP